MYLYNIAFEKKMNWNKIREMLFNFFDRLVAKKDTAQLISGIGPHKDTVLALLSAQRKNTGTVQASSSVPFL